MQACHFFETRLVSNGALFEKPPRGEKNTVPRASGTAKVERVRSVSARTEPMRVAPRFRCGGNTNPESKGNYQGGVRALRGFGNSERNHEKGGSRLVQEKGLFRKENIPRGMTSEKQNGGKREGGAFTALQEGNQLQDPADGIQ